MKIKYWLCDLTAVMEVVGIFCIFSGVIMAFLGKTIYWHWVGAGIFSVGVLLIFCIFMMRAYLYNKTVPLCILEMIRQHADAGETIAIEIMQDHAMGRQICWYRYWAIK